MTRAVWIGVLAFALLGAGGAPPAAAQTQAVISPVLSPDLLGASASLTLTVRYTEAALALPSPVRRAVLRMPAGMSLYVPHLRACSPARLAAQGAAGCPALSRLGGGSAVAETISESQLVSEHVTLSAFLGPLANLRPTFEILAVGSTPVQERVVFGGSVHGAGAPYGEALELDVPAIETLPMAPEASLVSMSLTMGAHRARRGGASVLVPRSCPKGGFPFSGEFLYADGSAGSSTARVPCPH